MMGTPTTSRRKRRSPSEEDTAQDDASVSADAQQPSSKQHVRHRASVACASCRERRIRCVVPGGQSECTQCKRTGTECVIKNDDERRRPISKAYMSSLSNRIALLEGMLKEQGVAPPPAVHPPKTRQEALGQQQEDQQNQEHDGEQGFEKDGLSSTERHPPTPPSSVDDDVELKEPKREDSVIDLSFISQLHLIEPSILQDFEPKSDGNVRQYLCAKGRLALDQSAGRVRFFGPTANIHVFAESSGHFDARGPPEPARQAERMIRALNPPTHDHLMGCFWDHFNATHRTVDQATFEADRVSQDPKFYSSFLHITILAAGYRFADRSREDIKRLTLGSWESTLHRESRSMLDMQLQRPGELPSVQALLILADLECGVGRDTQAWMYSGMANRLAFDIGLHANCGGDVSETERRVRRQVMAACVKLDRQLALLFGRPTSIKNQDVSIDLIPKEFSSLSLDGPMYPLSEFDMKTSLVTDAVHYQLMELMGLSSNITDSYNVNQNPTNTGAEGTSYLQAITLDRQFQNWYRRLPSHLAWTPTNVKFAPLSFFLLHQQFHVCMILLHRPWAQYGPVELHGLDSNHFSNQTSSACQTDEAIRLPGFSNAFNAPQSTSEDCKVSLARSICTQHAIRVARIFWQHRQRFDGKKICLSAVQHAGTAALALMGALAHQSKDLDHQTNLRYLQVISSAIYDMSQTYHPAARMYHLLKSMLVDIRKEMVSSRSSFDADLMLRQFRHSVGGMTFEPAAWSANAVGMYPPLPVSPENVDGAQAVKKRRLSERHPSEVKNSAHSLFADGYTYPSPPTSSQSRRDFTAEKQHEAVETPSPDVSALDDESFGLDFDFLNGAIVDFDGNQGEIAAEITVAVPASEGPAPEKMETDNSSSIIDVDLLQPQLQPQPQLDRRPRDQEDTMVDMTIENWLAEPRVLPPTSLPQQNSLVPAPSGEAAMSGQPGGDAHGGMEWMVDADGDRTDMSLNDLVKTVQKARGYGIKEADEMPVVRNLELDFLSL